MGETVRVYHGSKRGLELWPDRRSLREASRAIHARFPLAEVLAVYPGFHTLDNNRAVDEMIELARKRAA